MSKPNRLAVLINIFDVMRTASPFITTAEAHETRDLLRELQSARVELERMRAWVPVSERLPPFGKRVLITVSPIGGAEYVAQDRYREHINGIVRHHWGEYSSVIAWRELPPPYAAQPNEVAG